MAGTRAVIAAASALLAGLLLGGCTGHDPVPKVEPSSSGSSGPAPSTGSPSSSPVRLSPVDTVRAWVRAQNRAMATGDLTAARGLATDDCESCAGLVDPVERVYKRGGHFETRGWTVDKVQRVRGQGRVVVMNAAVTIAGGVTYPSSAAKPRRFGAEHAMIVFKLNRVDAGWLVSFIGFLS